MKFKNRALSLLLSVVMVLTFMPVLAFAESSLSDWSVSAENDEVYLNEDHEATLVVDVDIADEDNAPDLSFIWYDWDDSKLGDGATEFTVSDPGDYYCKVSDGEREERVDFYVYSDDTDEEDGIRWYASFDDWRFYLENGSVDLQIETTYNGEGTPSYTYQWYKETVDEEGEFDYISIAGATSAKYTAKEKGTYKCEVTIDINGVKETTYDTCEVYSWRFTNDTNEVLVDYGKSATLTVKTNYTGKDISYQWGRDVYNAETEEWDFETIEGATKPSYTVNNITGYQYVMCEVTADGYTDSIGFDVEVDTSKYNYIVTYPDATAQYKTANDRKLKVEYTDGGLFQKFPDAGDSIEINNGKEKEVYVFVEDEEEGENFVSESGEVVYCDLEHNLIDASSGKVPLNLSTESVTDHNKKTITQKYDISFDASAEIKTDTKSIKFEPASINLYSEDVKETWDGNTFYDFEKRYKNSQGYYGAFVPGDKLTVTYNNYYDGKPVVYTYVENDDEEGFVYNNGKDSEWIGNPYVDGWELKPGNNTVTLRYRGVSTAVNVFMDTPELKTEREKAAEWNGVLNTKIPAAKNVEAKAGKKRITVSWKKATKKNLKKFDKVEIQVCTDKKFAQANTIRKIVKKSKKSATIKKLKKGKTYYVRVRDVKGTGTTKQVSKWSKVKKVKIKK